MKINSIVNSAHSGGGEAGRGILWQASEAKERRGECAGRRMNKQQNNYDNINTSIKSNPDARASFKGAEPLLHKAAHYAAENPLPAEALFVLPITCALRPLTIMAQAKTDEDKKKCSYQAAKAVSSGLVGLAMTVFVSSIIKAGFNAAKNKNVFSIPQSAVDSSSEIIQKGLAALKHTAAKLTGSSADESLSAQIEGLTANNKLNLSVFSTKEKGLDKHALDNFKEKVFGISPDDAPVIAAALDKQAAENKKYETAAKNLGDKMFQPVFLIVKAMATVALIPVILKKAGFIKPAAKKAPVRQETHKDVLSRLNTLSMTGRLGSNELFQPFMEGKTK